MKTAYHSAATRGNANHGWLNANHSFSFAQYYNPERMNFGALRVLNDDTIAPSMGFGTHPHDNMEIITIPLEGDLEHKDSMGNVGAINEGEIQVMSAGTGVYHSEYNKNKDQNIENKTDLNEAFSFNFLNTIRQLTITAFKGNEYIGENVLAYVPIPGQQKGCVDLQETTGGRAWSL